MKKYYIGYVFDNGNIVVDGPKSVSQPLGGHDTLWLIRCVCGNERWTYTNSVRKSVYPCKRCYDNSMKLYDDEGPAIKKSFISLKSNAKARNIAVDISESDFLRIAKNPCTYCGALPIEKTPPKKWQVSTYLNGVDRVDNSLGYTIYNSVACCYDCNRIKSDLTEVNFLKHIKKIYDWSINA
jgi:hypothetical protein